MDEAKLAQFTKTRLRKTDECPICMKLNDLYEYDCGCLEHCFCLDCYYKMDICPLCKFPKNPYYIVTRETAAVNAQSTFTDWQHTTFTGYWHGPEEESHTPTPTFPPSFTVSHTQETQPMATATPEQLRNNRTVRQQLWKWFWGI